MAFNLYRRHRRDCKVGHAEESRSGEFDERKKGWRRCDCPIFVSGTINKRFQRKSTSQWEWEQAKAVAAAWEASANFSELVAQSVPVPALERARTTIAEATEAFVASRSNRGVAAATVEKYHTFAKQLVAYAQSRGYVMVDQLTVSDMDRFYASWKDGKRSKARKLERLKAFSKFCLKREWISKDIADDLHAPEGAYVAANKMPFTDAELDRIYAACDSVGGPTPPGPGHRPWGGEDVKDFVMLSIYTGLRISDVATFNITKRLKGNDVFLRMHKTKKDLYTWIPNWLVERLHARERSHGHIIFRAGPSLDMRIMAERWRRHLAKVFEIAGPFDETPTPHRFRHTFVRVLLEKGVPVSDVAELIGDTEEIVRQHYARWVPERQARLTKILQDAFDDKPKPKLVSIR